MSLLSKILVNMWKYTCPSLNVFIESWIVSNAFQWINLKNLMINESNWKCPVLTIVWHLKWKLPLNKSFQKHTHLIMFPMRFIFFVSFVVYWSTIAVSIAYWLIIDTIMSIIGKINERWNSKYDVSFMNLHVCVSQTQKFCNVDLNESFEHICT